ncbi:major facilitator superfamily domain-containing protein [Crucibulum laeve]|uniref:Major facilitator superfamily domain-containing protein n=1 Tax=Crucibulum laeve TaxID=68775 RepID=A0A5C3LKF2_9AGAR|nr:major facilitator superfamily domain-containing protein [Crucibulum laeve]
MSMTSSTTYTPPLASEEKKKKVGSDPVIAKDPFQVFLEHHEHPQQLSLLRKWIAVIVISSASLCVAYASSLASFTEEGVANEFGVGHVVTILSISLFVEGLGLGPLLIGPLSEVYGRNAVYWMSYGLFFVFSWPVAFAPNIAVHLIFRFVTGFCGSAFLSVAGGSVSDLFSDHAVANPMALYTISPFIGPVLGPLLSGFINQHLDWRWTYHVEVIWIFIEFIALLILVPETYVPVLTKRKAKRVRKATADNRHWAPIEKESKHLVKAIAVSCYKPFELLIFDRMALLLDIWTALILGILYLAFQAFPVIFEKGHGFNMQSTGMSFLGIGLGMLIAISTQPYWNNLYRRESERNGGNVPPEARLFMGEVGGILVPIGLFWLAFTTYSGVPWIVPIIASIPFGSGIYFVFTSTFTYLVTAYRPIAASAMAANSAMRSTFAAAFPLFAGAMYSKLGTVGATALLAGLTTIMAPLPFIFRRIGPRLRAKSRFAA